MNILIDSGLAILFISVPAACGAMMYATKERHRRWLRQGIRLHNSGCYADAEQLLAEASTRANFLAPPESDSTIVKARIQLCWLLLQENRPEPAAKNILSLMAVIESGKNADASLTVNILEANAWHQMRLGHNSKAGQQLEQALEVCRRHSQQLDNSLARASVLCSCGWLYISTLELALAEASLRQSQTVLMSAVGAQSVHHLPVLMNLAWIATLRNDLTGANQTLAHAFKTYAPVLGKWHPRVAHVLTLLGAVAALDGDWPGALDYIGMAGKILKAHSLTGTASGQKIEAALAQLHYEK